MADQPHWLAEAGLSPRVVWEEGDLAVIVAEHAGRAGRAGSA